MAVLPIYKTNNKDIQTLQTNWSQQLNPVISQPFNQGLILKRVNLLMGINQVNHLLGRKLQGWSIVRQRDPARFYDLQDDNQTPQLTLSLVSSADASVDILVF